MKIIPGDITKATERYVCHQCNCVTNRAAHLAATMFQAFPWADIYAPRTRLDTPGTIIVKGDGKGQRFVIAMLGQVYPGRPKFPDSNKDGSAARQRYFKSCLDRMLEIPDLGSIAFPYKIGCGAAGGTWGAYQAMIEAFTAKTSANVVVYRMSTA